MARVNVYLPDDLATMAKEQGLPISQLAQRAIQQELELVTTTAEFPRLKQYANQLQDITVLLGEDEVETTFRGAWIVDPSEDRSGSDWGLALTGRGRFAVLYNNRGLHLQQYDTYEEMIGDISMEAGSEETVELIEGRITGRVILDI